MPDTRKDSRLLFLYARTFQSRIKRTHRSQTYVKVCCECEAHATLDGCSVDNGEGMKERTPLRLGDFILGFCKIPRRAATLAGRACGCSR